LSRAFVKGDCAKKNGVGGHGHGMFLGTHPRTFFPGGRIRKLPTFPGDLGLIWGGGLGNGGGRVFWQQIRIFPKKTPQAYPPRRGVNTRGGRIW